MIIFIVNDGSKSDIQALYIQRNQEVAIVVIAKLGVKTMKVVSLTVSYATHQNRMTIMFVNLSSLEELWITP